MYPLFPALVTRTLGGGAVTLGALDGLSDAASALAKVGSGWLADRPGWRRPLVVLGYAVAAAARPVIGLASQAWQVVMLRSADRLGKGLRTPPRDAVIADATNADMRGRAFGFHRAMDHAGAVAGPLVATALLTVGGLSPSAVVLWTAVPGAMAVAMVWWALYSRRERGKGNGETLTVEPASAPFLFPPSRFPFFLIIAFAAVRMPETLFLLRLQDLGLAVALTPVLWAALHVVRSAASYPGGWLSDRLGPLVAMAIGWVIYGAVCAGLATASGPVAGAGWFLAFGLVAAATEAAERAYVAAAGGAGRRGLAFGAYHAAAGLAALPGGIALGLVYARASGSAALVASGALTLLLGLGAVLAARRHGSGQ